MIVFENLFHYPSLHNAKLLTGETHLQDEVNGVMVMEAPDIELWGRRGLLLLTSYYALQKLCQDEMAHLFHLMKTMGIAGIAVKTNPSLTILPDSFITLSRDYDVPLLQLHEDSSLEKISTEILESIINRNAMLLKNYYEAHKKFNRLMMKQSDLPELLHSLKAMIHRPVSLLKKTQKSTLQTDDHLSRYTILEEHFVTTEKMMSFPYKLSHVQYKDYELNQTFQQTAIPIPHHGHEEYELIIHELGSSIQDFEFMTIENAVMAIQMELIKRNALRHYNRTRLNEMASDLLHGRLSNQEDILQTIYHLKLHADISYHVMLISFRLLHHNDQSENIVNNRFTDALVIQSKMDFPGRTYVTRQRKVILIVPAQQASLSSLKEKAMSMVKRVKRNDQFHDFQVTLTISNAVKLENLAAGYSQAFEAQRTLQMVDSPSSVATYQDLGIYQIFMEEKNTGALSHFVPENIQKLAQESPDLLVTLSTFLNANQNYSETAEKLFVHPKTVRYRIDRLLENYQIQLDDPEKTLQYQLGIRLLNFLHPSSG